MSTGCITSALFDLLTQLWDTRLLSDWNAAVLAGCQAAARRLMQRNEHRGSPPERRVLNGQMWVSAATWTQQTCSVHTHTHTHTDVTDVYPVTSLSQRVHVEGCVPCFSRSWQE